MTARGEPMSWSGSYEELEDYLRRFVNFGPDPVPYDFNGVVNLMLALLDNLRERALDAELREIGGSMTDEQAAFLRRLADCTRPPDG
jgi:hypothetical protein